MNAISSVTSERKGCLTILQLVTTERLQFDAVEARMTSSNTPYTSTESVGACFSGQTISIVTVCCFPSPGLKLLSQRFSPHENRFPMASRRNSHLFTIPRGLN